VRPLQEIQDVFLEVRTGIDLRLVQKRGAPRASISRAICLATQLSGVADKD
jgi:hypothetical protein